MNEDVHDDILLAKSGLNKRGRVRFRLGLILIGVAVKVLFPAPILDAIEEAIDE